MTIDNFSPGDAALSGAWGIGLAALGRLLKMRDGPRPLLRWSLLFELPSAAAMAYIALGISEYMSWGVTSMKTCGLVVLLGYMGPEVLEKLWERAFKVIVPLAASRGRK